MTDITDAILGLLNHEFVLPNGDRIQGRAISNLYDWLRDDWRGLGRLRVEFESELTRLGFRLVEARSARRGQLVTVVTL